MSEWINECFSRNLYIIIVQRTYITVHFWVHTSQKEYLIAEWQLRTPLNRFADMCMFRSQKSSNYLRPNDTPSLESLGYLSFFICTCVAYIRCAKDVHNAPTENKLNVCEYLYKKTIRFHLMFWRLYKIGRIAQHCACALAIRRGHVRASMYISLYRVRCRPINLVNKLRKLFNGHFSVILFCIGSNIVMYFGKNVINIYIHIKGSDSQFDCIFSCLPVISEPISWILLLLKTEYFSSGLI